MTIEQLLEQMWDSYTEMNPKTKQIHQMFIDRGDNVLNDHIALRTFNDPRVGIEVLAKPFIKAGYTFKGEYHFEQKKLYAKHLEHEDTTKPKIFISELLLEKFSPSLQSKVKLMIDSIRSDRLDQYDFVNCGRPWNCSLEDYNKLKEESEYAAWLGAFGYRPNHFTVFVNKLNSFSDLTELNLFLKSQDVKLNESGGEIKGSPEVFLEQSSTLANIINVDFDDGSKEIPACYYEFALRHKQENGSLYQGFVAGSADKIFESTDKGQ